MSGRADYDVLVVGGGINGTGIARDAAGRGLRVLLCERDDLAQHTSSASTKLIHGGLRYLEHFEFALVRKALREREVLLRAAPHLIRPLRLVMPHDAAQRPAWLIRAGLFLYDHLAAHPSLPGCETLDLRGHPAGAALRPSLRKGFAFSDARVDDARLVVVTALDAAEHGACVRPRTACTAAAREAGRWRVTLQSGHDLPRAVSAAALVNAAGPWASHFLRDVAGMPRTRRLRLVKGSHIVVPRRFAHAYGYLLQNDDRRVVFALPFGEAYTLIGTTDADWSGDPACAAIAEDEVRYLCAAVNRYFAAPIGPADVVWSYAGVRPLLDDAEADAARVTRDYVLELDTAGAPLLSVFGGKLTTYRQLAEEAVDRLLPALGRRAAAWTAAAALPGGDLPRGDFEAFVGELRQHHPWLSEPLARRYAGSYGTRVRHIVGEARALQELGEQLAPGLYEAEARYLVRHEWARAAQDILWRRSKLGLAAGPRDVERLQAWLASDAIREETTRDLSARA